MYILLCIICNQVLIAKIVYLALQISDDELFYYCKTEVYLFKYKNINNQYPPKFSQTQNNLRCGGNNDCNIQRERK